MQRAIITGASSGIGEALARELSRRGWSLALLARRGDLLDALVSELKTPAVALPCDVSDRDAVRAAAARGVETLGGAYDLAVANAGIGVPTWATTFKLDDAERIIRVNVLGMLYLFDATVPAMIERGSGRFAGVASLAGLRGLPSASVYSASKAAMQAFLEASRVELAPHGVGVTIVNPGWVRTPMIAKHKSKRPFVVEADDAARRIADGLERGVREVEFPLPMSLLMRGMRLVPNAIYDLFVKPYAKRRIDPAKVRR